MTNEQPLKKLKQHNQSRVIVRIPGQAKARRALNKKPVKLILTTIPAMMTTNMTEIDLKTHADESCDVVGHTAFQDDFKTTKPEWNFVGFTTHFQVHNSILDTMQIHIINEFDPRKEGVLSKYFPNVSTGTSLKGITQQSFLLLWWKIMPIRRKL
jgi:hypothetical protein